MMQKWKKNKEKKYLCNVLRKLILINKKTRITN